jgi:hypothetical protein
MGHALDRQAWHAKRNTSRPGCLFVVRLRAFCRAANHVPGQGIHLATICVFGVHRLPASALKFLLLYAADKRLRTY